MLFLTTFIFFEMHTCLLDLFFSCRRLRGHAIRTGMLELTRLGTCSCGAFYRLSSRPCIGYHALPQPGIYLIKPVLFATLSARVSPLLCVLIAISSSFTTLLLRFLTDSRRRCGSCFADTAGTVVFSFLRILPRPATLHLAFPFSLSSRLGLDCPRVWLLRYAASPQWWLPQRALTTCLSTLVKKQKITILPEAEGDARSTPFLFLRLAAENPGPSILVLKERACDRDAFLSMRPFVSVFNALSLFPGRI